MTKLRRFKVRMRQRFEFPVDMLRYDGCWPASEEQSVRMATAIRSATDWVEIYVADNKTTIELATYGAPTEGRWLSFGWEVVNG